MYPGIHQVNIRQDEYAHPLYLINEVVRSIRDSVPPNFIVGIKLNSADYVAGSLNEETACQHIEQLVAARVDFIEISGGDYENPGKF